MKHTFRSAAYLLVMGMLSACSTDSYAQYGYGYNSSSVTLHSFSGYGGTSKTFNDVTPQLDNWTLNDKAESISVQGGSWLLCQDAGFAGPCLVARADIRDLDDFGMSDKISSVRPLPDDIRLDHGTVFSRDYSGNYVFYQADFNGNLSPVQSYGSNSSGSYGSGYGQTGQAEAPYQGPRDPDLIVYEDYNYRGAALGLNTDVRTLNEFGFNDRISSVEIRHGDWEFCTGTYFNGNCTVLDADQLRMSDISLNDNVSSVRKVATGTARRQREEAERREREERERRERELREAAVVVYADGNYKGRAEPINSDVGNLKPIQMNDNISSIIIREGSWEVCEGPHFTGKCATLSANTAKLNGLKLNDNISSIRRVK